MKRVEYKDTAHLRAIAIDYIKQRVVVDAETGCWNWQLSKFHNTGYGVAGARPLRRETGKVAAHTLSYWAHKGDYEPGLFVLHSCDNRACANPHHLRVGTAQDNADDCTARNRRPPARRKFTDNEISAVRSLREQGVAKRIICEAFGMSADYVWRLCSGRRRPV